jgi:hypothetical protein
MDRRPARWLLLALMLVGTPSARAQDCTSVNLRGLIRDLQTGHVNWPLLGPALRRAIVTQTGGTGRYVQLAQLGHPVSIELLGGRRLRNGIVCGYRTRFAAATLEWQIAFGFRIIQAMFFRYSGPGVGMPRPTPRGPDRDPPAPTAPEPSSGGGGGSGTPPAGEPVPSGTDDACKLYPNLC